MALQPVFVPTLDELRSQLRLSGLEGGDDATRIFEQAVTDARIWLYREIGAARAAEILATSPVENPTTDAQVLRALASSVEIRCVTYLVLGTLPVILKDGGATTVEIYNEEGAFRSASFDDIEALRASIKRSIDQDLGSLGVTTLQAADDVYATLLSPSGTHPAPGKSADWTVGTTL